MPNEFKFSTLRQFGSENVSFTATINSENQVLSEEEAAAQVKQIDDVLNKAFIAVNEREISEKTILGDYSEKRKVAVAELDVALKAEMQAKEEAQRTMKEAEKLSKKLSQ